MAAGPDDGCGIFRAGGNSKMVALVFGQSNSANYGQTPYDSTESVYSWHEGGCLPARDPLPGAGGYRGSVWTRLGDLLVERGMYDAVLFVPMGVGDTRVSDWSTGGRLNSHLMSTISGLKADGLVITHMLWHQGESDMSTGRQEYRESFLRMLDGIRRAGVKAPVYVSVATRYGAHINEAVRSAQASLPSEKPGIRPGPDTDLIGIRLRFDGVHFSDKGLDAYALAWARALAR